MGITFIITVQFTLSLSFCGYLKRLATNWRTQFLHRALIPVRHHSWFHLALSISHNQFGPSSGFQDRFILEAIHSSTLCFRSVWGSTWCVFFEEIFHYLKVCTWSMVRGARLNGSDWSESRCLKRSILQALTAAKSLAELTNGGIFVAVASIQSYLAIVDLSTTCLLLGSLTCWFIFCVKVIISERVEKNDIDVSAGQDKRHLLTGSVIKMDMMGQRNSSGAPESNSSSSLRSEMCKNSAFLVMTKGGVPIIKMEIGPPP